MLSFIKKHISVVIAICLTIVITPIVLNVVLQWHISNSVIASNNNGPATWLVFWGAFLSAIGAFTMALVSYTQNRNQSKIELKRMEKDSLESKYTKADLYVKEIIEASAPSSFLELIELYKKNKNEAHIRCLKMLKRISLIQQGVVQFISNKSKCSNGREETFFQEIKNEHVRLYDIYNEINTVIDDQEQGKILKNEEVLFVHLYKELFDVHMKVTDAGFDFLRNLREEIENKQQEINDLCKKL